MADTPARKGRLPLILGIVAAVVLISGYFLWRELVPRESTDDAEVTGHVSPIAPRVGGAVVAIHVNENQVVKIGDVLIEIDPHDYQVAVARATADLAAAQAARTAAQADLPMTSTQATSDFAAATASAETSHSALTAAAREWDAANARLAVAEAKLVEAQALETRTTQDRDRFKALVAKDEIPRQQYDTAVTAADSAHAATASARAAVDEAHANVAVADAHQKEAQHAEAEAEAGAKAAGTAPEQIAMKTARLHGAEAQVQQAQAALDQARLNLDRATVRAPINGVVSRKSVELGQMVQAGQLVLALVSLDDVWITANFKETQLRNMAPGQSVVVTVDSTGGREYRAHVDSIAAATGATFSLLPPENSSGNFVKVVQRVPVKIVLEAGENADHTLRPGMSADVTVWMR